MIIATEHPTIQVNVDEKEVLVTYEDRRWIFPKSDCTLLPIANTTAELLASYLCEKLAESGLLDNGFSEVMVAVDENEGQWGECRKAIG